MKKLSSNNYFSRGLIFFSLFTASQFALPASFVWAVDISKEVCEGGNGTWNGSECTKAGDPGLFGVGGIFQRVANALLFIVGATSVVMLIVGGIRYVVSAGDQNAVQGAKNTIIHSIIGIVVAFLAFAAVRWVIKAFS